MEPMEILSLVMRWLHILSAIALMGGTIFMRFALHPASETLLADAQQQLRREVLRRWGTWVKATSAFLLISGIVNIVLIVKNEAVAKPYHPLFGIKFLLALVILFIASTLTGRSKNAEKFREKLTMWLNINLLLAVIVVCIGGFLRTQHNGPKAKPADSETKPVSTAQAM